MARQWRIEYEGAFYHVLSRGNEKRDIVLDDKDRVLFLETLGRMSDRFDTQIFAYVLMNNHYHLLLGTPKANLSRALQWFGVVYTRRFNIRHHRSGHLFQGRFKCFLVENDSYLVQLSYYIHRNPLRSGLVKRLSDYRWSSYPSYAYGKNVPEWLQRDLIYSYFQGRDPKYTYRRHVKEYANEESRLWEDLRHGLLMGSEAFVRRVRGVFLRDVPHYEVPQQKRVQRQDPREILEKGLSLLQCDPGDFSKAQRIRGSEKENRDLLIYLLWASGHYKNEEISELFGLTYSAISHCSRQFAERLKDDSELKRKFDTINSQFKM